MTIIDYMSRGIFEETNTTIRVSVFNFIPRTAFEVLKVEITFTGFWSGDMRSRHGFRMNRGGIGTSRKDSSGV